MVSAISDWSISTYNTCSPDEKNYDAYDSELTAIVANILESRHTLERSNHRILIQCDNQSLESFQI